MPRKFQVPSYRLHRPSGRAVVTLNGKDVYLGAYNSPASKAEYRRVTGEWLARHQAPVAGDGLCLAEVMLAYLTFASTYYQDAEGKPGREVENIKAALRPLEELYATTPVRDFGPVALKAVRQRMVGGGLSRGVVNQRIGVIKRMFKWASGEELIPPAAYHGLACVEGLQSGRSAAKESEPVKPVSLAAVDAVLPLVSRQVRAMIQLQLLAGMRPTEVCMMRGRDLDTSGAVWAYRPPRHKTRHHGHTRTVLFGPKAQAVLRPFLKPADPDAFLFSPAEAEAERLARRRAGRRTPMTPSQRLRLERAASRQRRRGGRDHYDRVSYRRAVVRACDAAFGMPEDLKPIWKETPEQRKAKSAGREAWRRQHAWHPHQLRHSAATRIRRERGLDAARAVLGHRSLAVTETYAEIDAALAASVAAEMG